MKALTRRVTALLCTLTLCLTCADALSVEQAIGLLEEHYIDPLPAAAYEADTLDALFSAVGDPYTYYMSAAESERFLDTVEKEDSVTGIGAGISFTAEGIRITMLLDGGGAKDAGLALNDLIVAIDGVSCVPALDAHRARILGEEGTYVTLTVRRADGGVRDYRIERRTVPIHNTKVTRDGDVGVFDCDSFGSQTDTYFSEGIAQNNEQVTQWIVDLRDNLGGLADAASGSLGAFTGMGPKLFYRLADGESFYTLYFAKAQTDKPVIVLVNGHSASGSEIFSGGIRAERAGVVIGSRTFGKGTAQVVLDRERYPELFDGDTLKVTAYRFYCADGNTTDRIGVLPTLLVSDEATDGVAALLTASKPQSGEWLRLTLNGHTFYVDLAAARDNGDGEALRALLEALAPDAALWCTVDGTELALDPATVAAYLGVDCERRGFSDSAESPYAAQIDTLAAYRLLSGDGTKRFHPHDGLTRAELATMLANALNASAPSFGFTDVAEDSWYAGAVNAVASLGFMQGVGGGRFDPNGPLTQEQLVTVMGRLARFLNFRVDDYALALTEDALAPFARFRPWAREAASVLTGYDGNMLYAQLAAVVPSAPATREQAAATLCNILKTLGVISY
jgi:C-terminal peptidase prc